MFYWLTWWAPNGPKSGTPLKKNPGLFEHFAVTKGADDKASTGKKSELEDADPNLEHNLEQHESEWMFYWCKNQIHFLSIILPNCFLLYVLLLSMSPSQS